MRVQPTHTYATLAVFTLGLSALPSALAWGAAGHEIVATIAQMHLHPAVLPVLCDILDPPSAQFPRSSSSADYPPCHLAPIAAWADRVRRSPAYRYTAPLHYVGALDDLPSEACEFPGARGWAGKRDGNVLAAVRNSTTTLADFLDGEAGAREGEEALKFLVHFIGDMHMPLHLTGRERGGNGARVTFDGRVTSAFYVTHSVQQSNVQFAKLASDRSPQCMGQSPHRAGSPHGPRKLHQTACWAWCTCSRGTPSRGNL